MKRKAAAALAVVLLLALLQGCWNYQEVETLNIVAGIAIDRGGEGRKYHLTFDIADTSGAGKDKPVETTLLESEGDTLFDAIRNTVLRTGMRLYFQNCQIVVISREVAEEGIVPILDFILRDHEFRPTVELFVSQEETARDILAQKTTTMAIVSFEIDKMYELNETHNPVSYYRLIHQNYNTLASGSSELTLAALRLADNGEEKTAVLSGMALFRGDVLAGFLSEEDSKFAIYVLNSVKGDMMNVAVPENNTVAALEVFGNKTTVTPVVENGAVRFTVHTASDTALDELAVTADLVGKDFLTGFRTEAERQMREDISRVIALVQQQGVDIFGFGSELRKRDPDTWQRVKQNWNDVFAAAQVDVTCEITIRNTASKIKPAKVGE